MKVDLNTAGSKQEIKSLAVEYERDRASTPGDDCVEPQQKKRKSGQFHEHYILTMTKLKNYMCLHEFSLTACPIVPLKKRVQPLGGKKMQPEKRVRSVCCNLLTALFICLYTVKLQQNFCLFTC